MRAELRFNRANSVPRHLFTVVDVMGASGEKREVLVDINLFRLTCGFG